MIRLATLTALALAVGALFLARVQLPTFAGRTVAATPGAIAFSADADDTTLIGALSAAGYHPSVDELVELSDAGVDADLVAAAREGNLERPSLEDFIALAHSGVGASDVRDYAGLDAHLSARDMIALAQHGIGADDVDDLRTAGYRPNSLDDLIELRDEGVDGDYLRALRRHGYRDLSVDQIVRLHEAGVDV
ncbi:MAG: hypothetical protein ABI346_09800 [Candidatus Baltobacteraceae bacterium]